MQVTMGGQRLGAGGKMTVDLKNFERSTHDLSYVFRTTMSAGTLVPFINELVLPGDTFDIKLFTDIITLPTIGPLYGTYKFQLDIFQAPIRLYQGQLHNNDTGIGLNMQNVKLPLINLYAYANTGGIPVEDLDNAQINPSCILAFLGIRGVMWNGDPLAAIASRAFNAVPYIAYWDIYKNYYANKQEEIGAVIHTAKQTIVSTVTSVVCNATTIPTGTVSIVTMRDGDALAVNFTGATPILKQILVNTLNNGWQTIEDLGEDWVLNAGVSWNGVFNWARWGNTAATEWKYADPINAGIQAPTVVEFPLSNIDDMRKYILTGLGPVPLYVNSLVKPPYSYIAVQTPDTAYNPLIQTQEGLALKTYQSDMFNNWVNKEWITGTTGINEVSAVSTVGNKFTIDALYLANKTYQFLSRIAVSDGTYSAWINAAYAHKVSFSSIMPTYHGGLSQELIFQEVVSNALSQDQPLGTLAGRGKLSNERKGGTVTIKVDEPGYIIGIASLTPRIDYSQGNKWHTFSVLDMSNLHNPNFDRLGWQDSNTSQMAWWSDWWDGATITQPSYGKQTSWIHYQTAVNRTYGNFAMQNNQMFMTLNRRYEAEFSTDHYIIKDLTTYIDPAKYNYIFAQTSLDAQNFMVQIGVKMIARRKMSAKTMPNL